VDYVETAQSWAADYFPKNEPAEDPPRARRATMNKRLKLKVYEFRIEQFDVQTAAAAARRTVRGYETNSCACGALSDAHADPCRFCPEMPITYSCDVCD
jgi:hypothetical protein